MTDTRCGFTLIELSIVLVIIGLIIGGILVGQDLIKAAEVRAQISQIEKYNSAVNTFKGKFGALPGDMPLSVVSQFGFTPGSSCDGTTGRRDGNGLIDGYNGGFVQFAEGQGETTLFWGDLSNSVAGNLIDYQFPPVYNNYLGCGVAPNGTGIGGLFPAAKLGHSLNLYVYENNGLNWFGLSAVTGIGNFSGVMSSTAAIPVIQAYNMDKKMDDGLPASGTVMATYLNGSATVVQGTAALGGSYAPTGDTTTSCFNTTNNAYSISSLANYGANGNCALSFRFQ